MKQFFALVFVLLLSVSFSYAQTLRMAAGANWINIGDLDISGNQLTVEALVYWSGNGVDVVSKHTNPGDVNYLLRPTTFEISTYVSGNGGATQFLQMVNPYTLAANQWYHIAGTYDGAFVRYYVNGCLVVQQPFIGNLVQSNLLTAIGNQSSCQCEQYIGDLDEVRIWNVCRTQAQIQASMLSVNPATAGLQAYYQFTGNYVNVQGNAAWNGVTVGAPQLVNNPVSLQPFAISSVVVSNANCTGANSGGVAIIANVAGATYSIDGVNFQTNGYFPQLAAGSHTVYARSPEGCVLDSTFTISTDPSPTITASNDTAICNGSSAQLNVTGGLIYSWTPTSTLSNATIANPVATPATTTTYTVSSQVPSGNLIVNGNFSAGNTGFTSSYNFTGANFTEGEYTVGTSAQAWNNGMANCPDHTTGSGNMLIVNGATTANVSIWCQTINIQPNTDYAFVAWLQTVTAGNPAQLQFSVNGSLLGSVFTAPAGLCVWQQFYATWNSGAATTATICIVNQNTQASANDFTLDDLSFSPLCTITDQVTVTVNQPSTFTISQTTCPNSNYTLPDGTVVNTSGTYTSQLTSASGCDSIITVNLTVVPDNLVASNDTDLCNGQSAQLNATGGLLTYSWTPAATLTNASIANPVATPASTTTYIVQSQSASTDLIANGNFSSGNVGFTSDYTYTTNLQPEGTYYVGANPNTYHPGFSACPDHTNGSGNQIIVNGAGTAGLNVWCQTINVQPNTNYAFGAWAQSVAAGSPAALQFEINGSLIGPVFNAPANVCVWQQFYALWNSGAATTATICIINQNTTTGGNDFALDDISFVGLCDVYDTVVVTVHNPVTVIVDTAICSGISYTFPDGTTSTATTTNSTLLQTQYGCDSTINTNLTVNPAPTSNMSDSICSGQTYTLPDGVVVSATGTYSSILQTAQSCDSTIITDLFVRPSSTQNVNDTICNGSNYTLPDGSSVSAAGSYTSVFQNQFGCDSNIVTNLAVINVLLVASSTDLLCNGDNSGTVTATASNGVSPYNYSLLLGGSSVGANTTGNFAALAAGSYTVDVTDNFGCTATVSIQVNEPPLLTASAVADSVSCFGAADGSVVVSAQGGTPGYTYTLSGASNGSGVFAPLNAGNYTWVVTDAGNCSVNGTVDVYEPAQVLVQIVPDSVSINLGESIQLSASSNYDPNAVYEWSPTTGLSCTNCPNPTVDIVNSMTYSVQVSVNVSGAVCKADEEASITVIPNYEIFVPNAMSPGTSVGANDFFQIYGNLTAIKQLNMQVFNRIGEKVFESNDIGFQWNGSYRGALQAPQVFVWKLTVVFIDNHTEQNYQGSLTLVR